MGLAEGRRGESKYRVEASCEAGGRGGKSGGERRVGGLTHAIHALAYTDMRGLARVCVCVSSLGTPRIRQHGGPRADVCRLEKRNT